MKKLKEEKGDTSLFFLILIPVVMLILFAVFSNAQVEKAELDYIRSLENELDLTLADYDRQLWSEFGLWGVPTGQVNQYASQLEADYAIGDDFPTTHRININAILSNIDQLKKQILRHMSYRSLMLSGNELLQRFSEYENLGSILKSSEIVADLKNKYSDPQDILDNPADYVETPEPVPNDTPADPSDDQDSGEEPGAEDVEEAKNTAFNTVADLIGRAKGLLVPYYQSSGTDMPTNPLAPSSLSAITKNVDQLFINYEIPILSRLQIDEYMFNYYTSHCPEIEINDKKILLKTPYGISHQTLIDGGRENEVEQIIFHNFNKNTALNLAKTSVFSVCFTYHLIDKAMDEELQTLYLTEATALSAAIAAVSLGYVIIEPASLQYVIMLIDVLTDASADFSKVMDGKCMTIEAGDFDMDLNYRDFLRIFALLQSEENILNGLNQIRENTVPGEFAVSFALTATFDNTSFELKREFSDYRYAHEEEVNYE